MAASEDQASARAIDKFWDQLGDAEVAAATLLGWNEETWDGGDPEPLENKFWTSKKGCIKGARALTTEEKQAAALLGHTQASWDRPPVEPEGDLRLWIRWTRSTGSEQQHLEAQLLGEAQLLAQRKATTAPRNGNFRREVNKVLRKLRVLTEWTIDSVDVDEDVQHLPPVRSVSELFERIDTDHSNSISFSELTAWWEGRLQSAVATPEERAVLQRIQVRRARKIAHRT